MPVKIAYLMSRFPHLPETFILREMIEMERLGWDVSLYPLILNKQSVVHSDAKGWLPKANALPFFSVEILLANLREIRINPSRYISIFIKMLVSNATSPNFFFRALVLFPKIVAIAARMKAEKVRHIHAHYATHPALAAWLIHRLTGIPYSVTVHAHDIFVRRTMLATKLREANFIIAISNYNREYLTRVLGNWIKDKTYVIHCGVQPENYTSRQREVRKECFEIISIGSLQPYKGYEVLIEACKKLQERAVPFRCRIIGGGKQETRLRYLIGRDNLGEMVQLLGPMPQDEVAQLLQTADCYVQPSVITPSGKMEGIPVGIMEALACHLPVVATAISGVPELVRNGETGYLIFPQDSVELAKALEYVYLHPIDAAQVAKNGHELVLQEFDLRKNVRLLSALFGQSLRLPSTPVPSQVMSAAVDTTS